MTLYIPKQIKVGYAKRSDTYTGNLAYVIQQSSKLLKGWENWRDNSIPPDVFDNDPTEGFILNRAVQRYNWSHFGSNRSYLRVYDPRGFEFEISPENLTSILTETNCNHRQFDGKFVYAWSGKHLVLLPCGTQEFKEAQTHTSRKDARFSVKRLKDGHTYENKKGSHLIYMGRGKWTEKNKRHPWEFKTLKSAHLFWNVDTEKFEAHKSVSNIAFELTDYPATIYPELVSKLNKNPAANKIVAVEYEAVEIELNEYTNTLFALHPDHTKITEMQSYLHPYYLNKSSFSNERLPLYERNSIDLVTFEIKDRYFHDAPMAYTGFLYVNGLTNLTYSNRKAQSLKMIVTLDTGEKCELKTLEDFNVC